MEAITLKVTEIPLTSWIPLFELPMELSDTDTFMVGEKVENRDVINDGEIDTPCVIDIYGPAAYPTVRNLTTGKFIQINRYIESGQHIQINTEQGNKTIELVKENVIHWIGKGSTFFQLQSGLNIIEYESSDSLRAATVVFSYQKRYINL